jgi:hypothetical protein
MEIADKRRAWEDNMISAIGGNKIQQILRTNYYPETFGKDQDIKRSDKVRKQRPVEKSEDGQKSEMSLQSRDKTPPHNDLEDGPIELEKYDKSGKLVKKPSTGTLPLVGKA